MKSSYCVMYWHVYDDYPEVIEDTIGMSYFECARWIAENCHFGWRDVKGYLVNEVYTLVWIDES